MKISCVVVACIFASTNSAILRSRRETDAEDDSLRIIKKKPAHVEHLDLNIPPYHDSQHHESQHHESQHHESQHHDSPHHEVYPAHVKPHFASYLKPHFPPFPKPHFTVNIPSLGSHHGENYEENHYQIGSYGVNPYGEHQAPIYHSSYGGHPIFDAIRGGASTLAAGTLGLPFGPFGSFVGAFTKPFISNGLYHLTNGALSKSQLPMAVQDANGDLVMISEEAVRQLNPTMYQTAIPQDIMDSPMSHYRNAQPAEDVKPEVPKPNSAVNKITDVEEKQ